MTTRKKLLAAAAAVVAGLAAGGPASAAIRTLYPTGGAADVANVQSMVDISNPGDTIVLKARNLSGVPTAFNFSAMPSGGAVIVDVNRLFIQGELESKAERIVTRIEGPGSYFYPESYVAFDVRANEVDFRYILFDNLEAAMVIRAGFETTVVQECAVVDCAHGVFGYGDNDETIVKKCRMRLAGTPTGGNAAVTLQEGSVDCRVFENVFRGPGRELTAAAVVGILDYNVSIPADGNVYSDNVIRKCDAGIFVTSSVCQVSRNNIKKCTDGIDVVTEVNTGLFQGTQVVVSASIVDNVCIDHSDDGINLVGVQDSTIARNVLTPVGDYGVDCDESVLGTTSTGNTLVDNVGTTNCSSLPLEDSGSLRRPHPPVRPIEP